MDVLDKFFTKYSYKFPKGYPDLKDKQDILLMESILEELGVKVRVNEYVLEEELLFEEVEYGTDSNVPELVSTVKDSILSKGSGDTGFDISHIWRKGENSSTISKSVFNLYFKGLGTGDRANRKKVLENILNLKFEDESGKEITLKEKFNLVDLEKDSQPSFGIKIDDKIKYKIFIKGAGPEWGTDTDEKEGFVLAFYNSRISDDFNAETYKTNIDKVLENENWAIGLEGTTAKLKVQNFLIRLKNTSTEDLSEKEIKKIFKSAFDSLNDALSISHFISSTYPAKEIIRDKTFNKIRTTAKGIVEKTFKESGIQDADKWNPGDIYLKLEEPIIPSDKDIQKAVEEGNLEPISLLNDQFVDDWGDTDKPLVSISLKGGAAQLGRAKSYVNRLVTDDKLIKMNLSDKEEDLEITSKDKDPTIIKTKEEALKKGIEGYRGLLIGAGGLLTGNDVLAPNFKITSSVPTNHKQLFDKFAAYKLFYYFLKQSQDKRKIEPVSALTGIAGFSHTVTKYNPTFFKITGSSNKAAKIFKIKAGTTTELNPKSKIEIKDSEKAGNIVVLLDLDFKEGDEVKNTKKTEINFRTSGGKVGVQAVVK